MYSDSELSVYACIYDIVETNLYCADNTFEYGKNTFLRDVASHPQDICVSKFVELPNSDFVQAIYVAAMKRLPDEGTVAFWKKRYGEPQAQFQSEVLKCIARSSVVAINHVHLVDNPYFKQKCGLRYQALGMLYALTDKSDLREFGKRLPDPLQRLIRKVFL